MILSLKAGGVRPSHGAGNHVFADSWVIQRWRKSSHDRVFHVSKLTSNPRCINFICWDFGKNTEMIESKKALAGAKSAKAAGEQWLKLN